MPFSFGDEILNEGDGAAIQCYASKGDGPIGLNFYHNENLIFDENDITITKSAKSISLTIDYLRAEHQGNYTCRASNRAGQTEYTAELNINGYCCLFYISYFL